MMTNDETTVALDAADAAGAGADAAGASDATETTVIPATLDKSNETPTETMPPVGGDERTSVLPVSDPADTIPMVTYPDGDVSVAAGASETALTTPLATLVRNTESARDGGHASAAEAASTVPLYVAQTGAAGQSIVKQGVKPSGGADRPTGGTGSAPKGKPDVIDASMDDFAQTVPMTVATPIDDPTAAIPRREESHGKAHHDAHDDTPEVNTPEPGASAVGPSETGAPKPDAPESGMPRAKTPDAADFGGAGVPRTNDTVPANDGTASAHGAGQPGRGGSPASVRQSTPQESVRQGAPGPAPAWTRPDRGTQPVVQVAREEPAEPQVIRKTGPNAAAIIFGVIGILLGVVTLLFGLDYPTNLFFWLQADPRVVAAISCAVVGGALVLVAIIWALVSMIGSRRKRNDATAEQW
ncbi:hypothetical protein JS533_012050 [Bifidobacterium amazonense]|uniref:Uncharacterized protein n=1 Tax=Bifidobacterium amazonense TaxID=2809027 RepID=A0ABS9VY47_9BIFI|nr:hypothetical protein [Bifidobacterium amazonense]MCH9276988.1 hypothetical protein [Bifidobacterium amazonense]